MNQCGNTGYASVGAWLALDPAYRKILLTVVNQTHNAKLIGDAQSLLILYQAMNAVKIMLQPIIASSCVFRRNLKCISWLL